MEREEVNEMIDKLIKEITTDIQPVMVNGSELVNIMLQAVTKTTIITLPLSKNGEEQDALTDMAVMTGVSLLIQAGLYSYEKAEKVANALYDAVNITKRPMQHITTGMPGVDKALNEFYEED